MKGKLFTEGVGWEPIHRRICETLSRWTEW